jgi:hypothetical protein
MILESDRKHLVVVFKEGTLIQKEVENDGSSKGERGRGSQQT